MRFSSTSDREKKLRGIVIRLIMKGPVKKKNSFSGAAFINKAVLIREEYGSKAL